MNVSSLAPDDFAWLTATEQLAALAAGELSSAELVELYLSRISTHNGSLNAIVTVDPDAARRTAAEADAARSRGDDLGPLHGLPITVKDSYETAGMRTVCGRPDLADYVPTQDAEAIARLRRSGAIIVGKTNMPTGNADVQASNPVFGRTGARTRILNAASELFYFEGINATGVGRIASKASVSKRTLYQHFPSKSALVEEYLRQLRQEAGEAKRTPAENPDTTPRAQLLALFDIADGGDARMRGCPFHNAAVEAAGVMPGSSASSTCTSATTWMGSSTWPDRRGGGPGDAGQPGRAAL